MKQISIFKKPISVLLAFCFIFALAEFSSGSARAEESALSPEQEKAAIEQRIKEANNKIDELKQESADTQKHLEALNEKIDYLEQEMKLVDNDVKEGKANVEALQEDCEQNEKAIYKAVKDIENLTVELDKATEEFDNNYEAYRQRLRAMYISGDTSILSFILTSADMSQFLTRYEMLRRISKRDSELLDTIKSQMKDITEAKQMLSKKENELTAKRTGLLQSKEALEKSIIDLESKQNDLNGKKTNLSVERANANVLLSKLSDETGYYTEFLEDNKESLEEVDKKLAAAADKYIDTVVTTTTTTTAKQPSDNQGVSSEIPETTKKNPSNYIKLTYPVPSQTKITCGFYGYPNHNGVDFACPMNSNVVAAESGTVIISDDLTNPDGTYRSYGRYIVILHDKTTKSGEPVYTLYGHTSVRLVSEGQKVAKGQLIAYSGSTGNSTGPHCHFEVRTPSSSYLDRKNPVDYLP